MEENQKPPGSSAPPASEKSGFSQSYANRVIILFSLLAAFVLYVDIMLTPSLPSIASDYKVSIAEVSLVISLYTVFGTAVNPVIGKLGDILGKKRILIYVLIIYAIMVAITSFASNFTILLISRTVQGIGLGIFPLAFSLVREEFPREMVPRAQGILSAMFGAGAAFGLPLGALVANSYGWQANYHIALPFIVVLTVLIYFAVRESSITNPNAKLDYVGAVWLGGALGALVFGLSEGSTWGWTSPSVLGLTFGGLILLFPLVFYERRILEPILNLKLLAIRNVMVSNVVGLTSGAALFLAFQAITFQLELGPPAGYGFDILKTGIYLVPLALAILVVAIPVGRLTPKYGTKPFLYLGCIVGSYWVSAHFHGYFGERNSCVPGRGLSWIGNSVGGHSEPAGPLGAKASDGSGHFFEHRFQKHWFKLGSPHCRFTHVYFRHILRNCGADHLCSNSDCVSLCLLHRSCWLCNFPCRFCVCSGSHGKKSQQASNRPICIARSLSYLLSDDCPGGFRPDFGISFEMVKNPE